MLKPMQNRRKNTIEKISEEWYKYVNYLDDFMKNVISEQISELEKSDDIEKKAIECKDRIDVALNWRKELKGFLVACEKNKLLSWDMDMIREKVEYLLKYDVFAKGAAEREREFNELKIDVGNKIHEYTSQLPKTREEDMARKNKLKEELHQFFDFKDFSKQYFVNFDEEIDKLDNLTLSDYENYKKKYIDRMMEVHFETIFNKFKSLSSFDENDYLMIDKDSLGLQHNKINTLLNNFRKTYKSFSDKFFGKIDINEFRGVYNNLMVLLYYIDVQMLQKMNNINALKSEIEKVSYGYSEIQNAINSAGSRGK